MELNNIIQSPFPSLDEIGDPLISPIEEGPPDIFDGLLPSKGQVLIAGETNIGKSLLALEITSSFITGTPLWGEKKPSKVAKRVIYILGEHYNEVIKRLWQKTKLPMTKDVILIGPEALGYDKWLVAAGRPNPLTEEKLKKWIEGSDLVIWDPMAAFATGVDTENDNIQMRMLLERMSYITHAAGATGIVLAHVGKPMMDRTGTEHSRKSYAVRGASGIEDAATNIFYLQKAEGASIAAHDSQSMVLVLKCRKYKGEAPGEYRLMRNPHTLTHSLLGNRPFSEVRKIETQAKIGRLHRDFPDLKTPDIIKIIAATENISESTVRRYLD